MNATDMLKKLRAYYHFIKKQQRYRDSFGVHPLRAVLIETTNELRARKLMDMAHHPLLGGQDKRVGLFWFTISPTFTDATRKENASSDRAFPHYLDNPATLFTPICALPDGTLHAFGSGGHQTRPVRID